MLIWLRFWQLQVSFAEGDLLNIPVKKQKEFCRFEREKPNELWQMDFKGHFRTQYGTCYPLTILDDHSRFSITVKACSGQTTTIVKKQIICCFQEYGLPKQINVDNGPPWGKMGNPEGTTYLYVWLARLGVKLTYSRPYHPQTNGKEERFHRTLKTEILKHRKFKNLKEADDAFYRWRHIYNYVRPHEALDYLTPSQRYCCSAKLYPDTLPPIEYNEGAELRLVGSNAHILWQGKRYRVGNAFKGERVEVKPTAIDGIFAVYFGQHFVNNINVKHK